MRPWARSALTAGIVVAVLVVGTIIRTLITYGVFTDVTPGFAGTCNAVASPQGPEDIAIDAPSGLAFVSASDIRAAASGHPSPRDGIYTLRLGAPAALVRLAGAPRDFHPHGIGLYRDAGGLVLMAVNHRGLRSSIEVFDVAISNGAAALRHTGSIESPLLLSPNAVAAVDRARFYVSNDHGSTTVFGRKLEDLLVLPRADLLYFDGMTFRVVAQRLSFANGLALSPDARFLYAAESFGRRVDAFARQPVSGALEPAGSLAIPSGVDNLRFDERGDLWIGSWPKTFAVNATFADRTKPAPSEVFKVTLENGIPTAATPVFTDNGHRISAASVAAASGRTLLIGSPFDDRILKCEIDH